VNYGGPRRDFRMCLLLTRRVGASGRRRAGIAAMSAARHAMGCEGARGLTNACGCLYIAHPLNFQAPDPFFDHEAQSMNHLAITANARAHSGAGASLRAGAVLALGSMQFIGGVCSPGEGDLASP